jgi:hypothetical protein
VLINPRVNIYARVSVNCVDLLWTFGDLPCNYHEISYQARGADGKLHKRSVALISIYRYQRVATTAAHWPYKKFRDLGLLLYDAVMLGK